MRGPIARRVFEEFAEAVPFRMAAADLPGLAVAIVDAEGVVWKAAFGVRERGSDDRLTTRSLFGMQSISKVVTATGVLMAVRDGLLGLDEPISTYLPKFQVQSRFGGVPEREITLRHLLSHRSGLAHEAPVGNNFDTRSPSFSAHVESISDTWLRYPVGQRFSYSNLGVDLCGYVLQVVREKPFSEWMETEVLRPLGMRTASYEAEVVLASSDRAVGHDAALRSVPVAIPMVAAGALYASVEDMAAFVQMMLAGGVVGEKVFLGAELLREMQSIPFAPGQSYGYALCIARRRKGEARVLQHGAGGFGYQSDIRWYPDQGFGQVVLTNSIDQSLVWDVADGLGRDLIRALGLPASSPEPAWVIPQVQRVDSDRLAELAGTYVREGEQVELSAVGGELRLRFERQEWVPFQVVNEALGYVRVGGKELPIGVLRYSDGTPWSLVRRSDGTSFDRVEGSAGEPGPGRERWREHVGVYTWPMHGVEGGRLEVSLENGWLLLDGERLSEHTGDVFFTSSGNVLDLRGEVGTWRSASLTRLGRRKE